MLNETLRKVASTLDELHVPYALIGGLAVSARGAFRTTKDVDLLIDHPLHEGPSLTRSLNEHDLPAAFHKGAADDPVSGVIRVVVPTAVGEIKCDVLFPSKLWQAEAVRRATRVDMGGFIVPVVPAADLFLLKLHAGGTMDLFDAARLLELQTAGERRAWEKRATEIHRSRAYARCLKFLREGL